MVGRIRIRLSDLDLKEKVGQMIMVRADNYSNGGIAFNPGGVFIDGRKTREEYLKVLNICKERTKIKLLSATDMEGYWNPFSHYKSKTFGEIRDEKEAYLLGREHGKMLKEAGFNLNFSPIVEMRNNVWKGRSFTGRVEEIREKIIGYIRGLKMEEIMVTAKHYPGGSMIRDPHKFWVKSKIDRRELENFDIAIGAGAEAIMVGHTIVRGLINSEGKQSTVSKKVIKRLRDKFNGLIISDDINMLGLKLSYLFRNGRLYIDLIKAGNDIILDSWKLKRERKVEKGFNALLRAVESGEIDEERINESVKRILTIKGYKVV